MQFFVKLNLFGCFVKDSKKPAYDMKVGIDRRGQIRIHDSEGTYTNYPYLAYRYLSPYMNALGIPEEEGLEQILANGDYNAKCRIDELIRDVTKKLIDGLYDTWEFFASDDYS